MPLGAGLSGMVAGLVLRSRLGRIGRDLLQERRYLCRGRRIGLVEKGDDVTRFMLEASRSNVNARF